MIHPIKILDFDLASPDAGDLPVPDRYRQARVLVRWTGRPIGTVHVPTHSGCIRRVDIVAVVLDQLGNQVAVEFVRRALLTRGEPGTFSLHQPRTSTSSTTARLTLSVVICTRDRPDDLAICLAAIATLDPAPLETIIVDNAPTTEASADLVRRQYPQFRYVREETPGLDHARNRGIREAGGDIIAFTDDDVVVDSYWAGALVEAFATDETIGLVTGLVEPFELETEAQVLFENYGGFGRGYRRRYLQAPARGSLPWNLIGAGQLGAGASMAVRRSIFHEVGLFDPALDVGTGTLGGGDHEMFFRIIKSGWLCIHEPAAFARHRHRRSREAFKRLVYSYGHGTRAFFDRIDRHFPENSAALRKLRRWWWREWALKRWWRGWSRPSPLPAEFVFAEMKGYIQGRGAYARVRRQLVPNETARPDTYNVSKKRGASTHRTGTVFVEVSRPLQDLEQAAEFRALQIVVQLHGEPMGSFRMIAGGRPISAGRLADEIAHQFSWHILHPRESRVSAWTSARSDLRGALNFVPAASQPLPHHVTASIVVPTCDRPDQLRRCLVSLKGLVTSRPVEIIVVDNRPQSSRTAELVAEFPGVQLVRETLPGSAFARNAGIAAARGDIVAMTDDDMVVSPEWLERLLEPFARGDIMAVTGNTMPARTETEAERWFEAYGGFCRGFDAIDFDQTWFHSFGRRVVPTWKIGGSGNVAFRREIFARDDIGPFDPRLGAGMPTGVGEDTQIFYAILHAGFTIAYRPAALAWHHHRITMPQLRSQLYAYSKGHVGYHLITLLNYGDTRAIARILIELPHYVLHRMWRRARGSLSYPWRLLLVEAIGTALGPWALWRSHRLVHRLHKAARRDLVHPPVVTAQSASTHAEATS